MVMWDFACEVFRWFFPPMLPRPPVSNFRTADDVEYVRVIQDEHEPVSMRWGADEGDPSLALLAEEDAAYVAEHGYDWASPSNS